MLDRLPGGHSAISGLNRTIAEIVGGPLFREFNSIWLESQE